MTIITIINMKNTLKQLGNIKKKVKTHEYLILP